MTPAGTVAERRPGARQGETPASGVVSLRPFPYPYGAALAICSDLDETPTAADYLELMRFLNTTETTRHGVGVGLEVGNSIYFDMPSDQFSYWNADDRARAQVRALIQSGHVDCLHSFGDLASTRRHAGRALDDLSRHGCSLKVWVDHAIAPSNFGADIMRGSGDDPAAPVFHADLTVPFGIEYVWRGRVTSVVGQDTRRSLRGIASAAHPLASAVTIAKEAAKGALGRGARVRYAPHASNRVVWESTLRSGHRVYEFLRSNPTWAGISVYETRDGLGEVVTPPMLRRLVARQGACMLYTHLGKTRASDRRVGPATREALQRLSDAHARGEILVTTTARLLDLCRLRQGVAWTVLRNENHVRIEVSTAGASWTGSRPPLDGLTFYVPDACQVSLIIDGRPAQSTSMNPPDASGRRSVSLPWPRLSFPVLDRPCAG